MEERLPLVYFHGLVPGKYFATWPVYLVRDFPELLTFSVRPVSPDVLQSGNVAATALAEFGVS
jgi:hypothetical protein